MKPPKFASTGTCTCAALADPGHLRSQRCTPWARTAAAMARRSAHGMACAQTPTPTLSEET